MKREEREPDSCYEEVGNSTSAMTLREMGLTQVPSCYVLPPNQRPNTNLLHQNLSTTLPIIDFSCLQDPSLRSQTIDQIRSACQEIGSFQVINHGIPISVMKDCLHAATEFFNLPMEEKMLLLSDSVHEPVRYGTSVNHVLDEVHFWRDFLKHYSHPLSKWIHLWPSNPPSYREKMGTYTQAVQVLQKQLMQVVLETLGLNPNYIEEEVEKGSQVMAVNCYPPCPEPELALGMPPHSDYGSLTILLQSSPGLQLLLEQIWVPVPVIDGALIVQLGDQLEVMSNGRYKSVVHRVTVNTENQRQSIASLHSLGLDEKMRPAAELVDEQHPAVYKEFSFNDFLDYVTSTDILKGGRFIDSIRTN